MQNRLTHYLHNEDVQDPTASAEFTGEAEDEELLSRNLDDVFHEIKDHLTKEELVIFSVYKNSKRKRNHVYKVFFEKACGKSLSISAITHRKNRIFKVLNHVGAMLKFKRTHGIDSKLKQILTDRQFVLLMMYERRMKLSDIKVRMEVTHHRKLSCLFRRALERLKSSKDADIQRYLILLGNVLRFSRMFPISKR